jgi:hypothetical protein
MSFTAITPDMNTTRGLWQSLADEVFTSSINQVLQLIDSDFQATIAAWKQGPVFTIDAAQIDGNDYVGSVWTDNEIYGYVNNGTSPHDIRPVKAKKLHFLSGYAPKTYRRVLGSQQGGPYGADVFASAVHHPGSEARQFDQVIVEKRQSDFEAIINAALSQAASKAGG